MLDLKLHLITILNNVIFLGLTKLAKTRLGRDAVQTSTQIISSYLRFPQTSWASHVFQPSWPTITPHLCHCLANCMLHPASPWLTVPFPLPPSCPSSFSHFPPSCKRICWFPTWTPDSPVALPSWNGEESFLPFTQSFALCSLAFSFCSSPSSRLTLLLFSPLSPPVSSKTHFWQCLEAAQFYPILS